jgi:hypothetical protein
MIITLLRKPLEGTVAENALQHGCGAINIDATRVSTSDNLNGGAYAENPTERGGADMWTSTRKGDYNCFKRGGGGEYEQPSGRWPANFILTHLEGCELKGTKKVKGAISKPSVGNKAKTSISMNNSKDGIHRVSHAGEDGNEEVEDWACAEGCPVQELDRQSGHLKSGKMGAESYQMWGVNGIYGGGKEHPATYYGDTGGASRFFMQFKKGDDQ